MLTHSHTHAHCVSGQSCCRTCTTSRTHNDENMSLSTCVFNDMLMHVLSSPWQQVSCEHATSCWRPPVMPWAPWTWQTAASRRHTHQNTRNTELTSSRERRTNPEELSLSFQEMLLRVQMHYARINALCAVCLRLQDGSNSKKRGLLCASWWDCCRAHMLLHIEQEKEAAARLRILPQ